MLKQIVIQDLQPGMVIVRITEQSGPVKIKKAGLVTSRDMVQGLIEMGIQQVEIDPDQTVEVEAPTIKKSATIRMLESNKVTNTRIDDGLSEQFHRSLFLPSVQDIPSAWQFYTKRYLLAAFIALGGLALGWTLANFQQVLTLFSSQPNHSVVSVPAPVSSTLEQVKVTLDSDIEPTTQVDKFEDANTDLVVNAPVQQAAVPDEVIQSAQTSENIPTIIPTPEPQISADVLARFRKAMTEVEDLQTEPSPVESVLSKEENKVPRIDQLPAWVMNRLPSMAFSAHMYASVDSERWVRVNGTRMVEGDKIDGIVEIVRIESQHVILNYSGQEFSMAALTDW